MAVTPLHWRSGEEMSDDYAWLKPGGRVKSGRRTGTILDDVYSGYVTVEWDNGITEPLVHIRWLKPA